MTLKDQITKLTNNDLLKISQMYKIESRSNSGYYFNRRYNFLLDELKLRGLLK